MIQDFPKILVGHSQDVAFSPRRNGDSGERLNEHLKLLQDSILGALTIYFLFDLAIQNSSASYS